jgi:GNAT superfamily N-acetyltransferase
MRKLPDWLNASIHHDSQLAFSEAYVFVFCGYAEMLKAGVTHKFLKLENTNDVVYLKDVSTGKVISATVFHVNHIKSASIHLSYTDPAYRGFGLSSMVFDKVEEILRHRDVIALYSAITDGNHEQHRVLEKTGRTLSSHGFTKFYRTGAAPEPHK